MNIKYPAVFLSQPMRGHTIEEIKKVREMYYEIIAKDIGSYQFKLFDNLQEHLAEGTHPLIYLGNDIRMLSEADRIYFVPGWKNARGCRVEHMIAEEYEIPIYYL